MVPRPDGRPAQRTQDAAARPRAGRSRDAALGGGRALAFARADPRAGLRRGRVVRSPRPELLAVLEAAGAAPGGRRSGYPRRLHPGPVLGEVPGVLLPHGRTAGARVAAQPPAG